MAEPVSTEELERMVDDLERSAREDRAALFSDRLYRAFPHLITAAREALANRKAGEWRPIAEAPREIVRTRNGHKYGPYILAYPVHGEVARVRWWDGNTGIERSYKNFLDDGGNAVRPTHFMPLPTPPLPLTDAGG